MRKIIAALSVAGLLGAAACEADRETFEETDATLEPPPAVEAARENPVNPTGEALQDDAGDVIATDTLQEVRVDTVR